MKALEVEEGINAQACGAPDAVADLNPCGCWEFLVDPDAAIEYPRLLRKSQHAPNDLVCGVLHVDDARRHVVRDSGRLGEVELDSKLNLLSALEVRVVPVLHDPSVKADRPLRHALIFA